MRVLNSVYMCWKYSIIMEVLNKLTQDMVLLQGKIQEFKDTIKVGKYMDMQPSKLNELCDNARRI